MSKLTFSLFFILSPLCCSAQSQYCNIPGEWGDGSSIWNLGTNVTSYFQCFSLCQSDTNCDYFTHYGNSDQCLLFTAVTVIDNACTNCYSGERTCPLCGVPGFCQGPEAGLAITDTEDDCLKFCNTESDCQWYTFIPSTGSCILTRNCTYQEREDSLIGEKRCPLPGPTTGPAANLYQRLMTVGGDGLQYSVEIIDLGGNGLNCKLSNHPLVDKDAVGAFIGGRAVVCNPYNRGNALGQCHEYEEQTDTWNPITSSGMPYYFSASTLLENDECWWISGGSDSSLDEHAESRIFNGTDFSAGTSIPFTGCLHHMVAVNNSHVFIVEGHNRGIASDRVWLYDTISRNYFQLADVPLAKGSSFAGMATYEDGTRHIAIAAGTGASTSRDTSTWVYDLDPAGLDVWRPGPAYPEPVSEGMSVQYQGSFITLGGVFESGARSKKIYLFNSLNTAAEGWQPLIFSLETGKDSAAGFMIPDDYALCP